MSDLNNALRAQQAFTAHSNVVPLQRGHEIRQRSQGVPAAASANRLSATAFVASGAEPMSIATVANVKSAARRHATLDSALMSMINAAGVHGKAAEKVHETIKADPRLTAQAWRAFQVAHGRS